MIPSDESPPRLAQTAVQIYQFHVLLLTISRFGYVSCYDTKPKRRLFDLLKSQEMRFNYTWRALKWIFLIRSW